MGGGRPPAFSEEQCNELRPYLNHHTDATLEELKQARGVHCSLETVSQTLKRMGITRKKPLRASEEDREDVQKERHRFREEMRNERLSSRYGFVDESGAKTNMTGAMAGRRKVNERTPVPLTAIGRQPP